MDTLKLAIAQLCWAGEERLLYPGQFVRLGRAAENDIVLDDPKVSRMHAELEWNGTGFTLRDLGSINGTFINGSRLSDAARQLRDGDEIELSKTRILYELVRAPAGSVERPGAEMLSEHRGPRLMVIDGPDRGREYPLWGEIITIGRDSNDATWEIRLNDRSISRPHARMERLPAGYFLADLDSANGTMLNGLLISEPVLLHPGDSITLGETSLVFLNQSL